MLVYRFTTPSHTRRYFGTLDDAHQAARRHAEVNTFDQPDDLLIELGDVSTDKAGVLALLNCDGSTFEPRRRAWALTKRRGLRELPEAELLDLYGAEQT